MPKITDLEAAMLRNVAENNFADQPGDDVWADVLEEGPREIDAASIPGVVSSLVKKGLLTKPSADCVRLTAAGLVEWRAVSAADLADA